MIKKKSLYADIFLIIAAFIWGSGFIVTKNVLDHLSPYSMLFYRFTLGTILLIVIGFKKVKKATKKDISAGVIIGIILFIGFGFQTIGLKYTEAGKQAFIVASSVVLVPFMYWAMSKKRPDKFEVVAAFVCLIGIGLISLQGGFTIGYGDLLTLGCTFFYAIQASALGYYAKKLDPYIITVVQLATVATMSGLSAIVFEQADFRITSNGILPILYLAVFVTAFGFLVQTVAQRYTSTTHVAIILSTEAVFGSVLAIIFLKELFTIRFLIGCITILISVVISETKLSFLYKRKKTKEG